MDDEHALMEVNTTQEKATYTLDAKSLRRAWMIIKTLYSRKTSDSMLISVLLFTLCIGQQLMIYQIGLLPSQFFKVLGEKNRVGFKLLLFKAFSFIVMMALCNSAVKVTCGHLYVVWREKLTYQLQRKYFMNSTVLYHMNVVQKTVDNVDQRIGQDVERFCAQLRDIAPKLLMSPLTIVYYSIQCFEVTGYVGPIVIYTYFLLGTISNRLIMSSIVNLVFKQEKCEGDFRYWHTVIRSFAESVTFLGGEKAEFLNVSRFFQKLVRVQRKIINKEIVLNFSTNFFDYVGSILSYIVISVSIFAGEYDILSPISLSSLISRNAFVSMYLINCFSTLIDMSMAFTDLFAYTHRIGELIECLDFYKNDSQHKETLRKESSANAGNVEKNTLLAVEQMAYSEPGSSHDFVTNLDITVQKNKNLFITGKAGSGKSSLLRVLLGIWKPTKGKISINISPNDILFLPQKAFLTNGSLIDQVMYPLNKPQTMDYEKVRLILDEVGLQAVIARAGDIDTQLSWDWFSRLSPGEMQRLSFARVCYHQPLLAILDEPTSALGVEEEKLLYEACKRRVINYITVGHRESLKQYHDVCLEIKGGGEWAHYDL